MNCPWCRTPYGVKTGRIGDINYYDCDNCYYNWTDTDKDLTPVQETNSYDYSKDPEYLWWEKLPKKKDKCPYCGEKL